MHISTCKCSLRCVGLVTVYVVQVLAFLCSVCQNVVKIVGNGTSQSCSARVKRNRFFLCCWCEAINWIVMLQSQAACHFGIFWIFSTAPESVKYWAESCFICCSWALIAVKTKMAKNTSSRLRDICFSGFLAHATKLLTRLSLLLTWSFHAALYDIMSKSVHDVWTFWICCMTSLAVCRPFADYPELAPLPKLMSVFFALSVQCTLCISIYTLVAHMSSLWRFPQFFFVGYHPWPI